MTENRRNHPLQVTGITFANGGAYGGCGEVLVPHIARISWGVVSLRRGLGGGRYLAGVGQWGLARAGQSWDGWDGGGLGSMV